MKFSGYTSYEAFFYNTITILESVETTLFAHLRESHKLVWKKRGGAFEISVGDVVIVHEEKQPDQTGD